MEYILIRNINEWNIFLFLPTSLCCHETNEMSDVFFNLTSRTHKVLYFLQESSDLVSYQLKGAKFPITRILVVTSHYAHSQFTVFRTFCSQYIPTIFIHFQSEILMFSPLPSSSHALIISFFIS